MQMCNSPILSEKDITSSIDNISLSIKSEIEKLTYIFHTKHYELNDETNKAILNLPLVKKIICGYENELQAYKSIEEYIVKHDKYVKEHISTQGDTMSSLFIIIKRQEKTISSLQESIEHLQNEIKDIINSLSDNVIKIEKDPILEESYIIEECNIKLDIKEIQIDNSERLFFIEQQLNENEFQNDEVKQDEDVLDELVDEIDKDEEEEEEEEKDEEEEEEEEKDEEEKEEENKENDEPEANGGDDDDIDSIETENEVPVTTDEPETNDKIDQEDIEDSEEVWEITIDCKVYFTNNETNGILYNNVDGEPGDEIGKMINGFPQFF